VVSLLLPDQVGQAKRRFRAAKVDPFVSRVRPGDEPIAELIASGVPVEPVERPAREAHRAGGRRPRRDGDRFRRDGDRPRRSHGDRDRSFGDRNRSDRRRSDRPHRPARTAS
jgi:hypothetical protein